MPISVARELVRPIVAPKDTPIPILKIKINNLSYEKKSNIEKNAPTIRPVLIIGSFLLSLAAFLAKKGAVKIEKNGKTAFITPIKDLEAPNTSEKFEINKFPLIYEIFIQNPIKE